MKDWHYDDLLSRMHLVLEDGRKIAMPRYYKDKIYTDAQRQRIAHFAAVEAEMRSQQQLDKYLRKYGEDYYRVKMESDLAQFKKMFADSEIGRNIV